MTHWHGAKLIAQPDKTGRNFLIPLIDGSRATKEHAAKDVMDYLRDALKAAGGDSAQARQVDETITREWSEAVERGEMYALGPGKFFSVFKCDDSDCAAGRGRWMDQAITEIRKAGFDLRIAPMKR
ncbi:hypothetical protein AB0I72_26775 [Nocardiopsis sp. NPDC049922]|uniref:hypothetical protein n=1 Tax=Nocardiopsis sp. NPDC049922 TaxID=3155157 RepID=UPI00340A5757